MSKGESTKSAILNNAINLASVIGLEAISIGELANKTGMSKSGLYAHFKSKEQLQLSILEAGVEKFVDMVLSPSLKIPSGKDRLETLFLKWLEWGDGEFEGGCIFVKSASEYSERPGPVQDKIRSMLEDTTDLLARTIRTILPPERKDDSELVEQMAFEFWGVIVSYFHYQRLMKKEDSLQKAKRAYERLVASAIE